MENECRGLGSNEKGTTWHVERVLGERPPEAPIKQKEDVKAMNTHKADEEELVCRHDEGHCHNRIEATASATTDAAITCALYSLSLVTSAALRRARSSSPKPALR
jgi:hypothetical protein